MYIGCCMAIAMVYVLAIGVIAMGGKMKKKIGIITHHSDLVWVLLEICSCHCERQ